MKLLPLESVVGLTAIDCCSTTTTEETFGHNLVLRKAWRVVEAWLEASSSTYMLKVEGTAELWP